jgi:hypothetical protein
MGDIKQEKQTLQKIREMKTAALEVMACIVILVNYTV